MLYTFLYTRYNSIGFCLFLKHFSSIFQHRFFLFTSMFVAFSVFFFSSFFFLSSIMLLPFSLVFHVALFLFFLFYKYTAWVAPFRVNSLTNIDTPLHEWLVFYVSVSVFAAGFFFFCYFVFFLLAFCDTMIPFSARKQKE